MEEPLQPVDPTPAADSLMPNAKSMNTEALKMGLLMGALLSVYSVILQYAGLGSSKGFGSLSYLLIVIGLYLGVKNYRDTQRGGWLSFGQAFGMGFRIVLYAAILFAVYTYVFFKFIDHSKLMDMRALVEQQMMEKKGVTEEQRQAGVSMSNKYFLIPGTMAIIAFLGDLAIGALLSLLTAAVLKREPIRNEPPMP